MNKKMSVFSLAWPIFIEIFLFMVMGNIDVIMLSNYNEHAVAAVGNANQIFSLIAFLFSVITASTAVLFAQYLGAGKRDDLDTIATTALSGNLVFSLVISGVLIFFNQMILRLLNVPTEVIPLATDYILIVGGLLFIHSLSMTLTSMIKSAGHTKPVMFVALGMNITNVIGNYIFLFGPLGLPVLGVKGVAISTAFSRGLAFLYYFYYVKKHLHIHIKVKRLFPLPKEIIRKMLRVGVPSAMEPFSWQMSQLVIFSMINILGITVINTKMYVTTLTWFVFLSVLAISQASQIIVGHLVGAGKEDQAKDLVLKNVAISLMISVSLSILLAIFGKVFLGFFTEDPNILALGQKILILDIFVEIGRVFNLVIISSAKGAGDVKFPAMIGIIFMWTFSALGSYLLGLKAGLGLAGIWIAMASDEWIRAVIMYIRWKKELWRGKKLV